MNDDNNDFYIDGEGEAHGLNDDTSLETKIPEEELTRSKKPKPINSSRKKRKFPTLKKVGKYAVITATFVAGIGGIGYLAYDGDVYGIKSDIQYRSKTTAIANEIASDNNSSNLYEIVNTVTERGLTDEGNEGFIDNIESTVSLLNKYRGNEEVVKEASNLFTQYLAKMNDDQLYSLVGDLQLKDKLALREILESSLSPEELLNQSIKKIVTAEDQVKKSVLVMLYDQLEEPNKENFVKKVAQDYQIKTLPANQVQMFNGLSEVVDSYCRVEDKK